jgi:hypothetical protein
MAYWKSKQKKTSFGPFGKDYYNLFLQKPRSESQRSEYLGTEK